jgi:hypothetical protein
MLDSRYWMLDTGCKIQISRFMMHDSEDSRQKTVVGRCWMQKAWGIVHRVKTRCWILDAGCKIQDTR